MGLCLIVWLATSAIVYGGGVDNDFYRNKMMNNMKLASLWIIEDGIQVFTEKGKDGLHRKLVDEWGVQIWVDPWVESERYLALFRIKARGINYDIHNLFREKVGGLIYEFWLVKVSGTSWSGEGDRSVFLITEAEEIFGKRKVLKSSDQVIQDYQIGNVSIQLPIKNMELLYDMQAWLFPENYKYSDLAKKEVVMDRFGKITFKKDH